jgi:alkylation response protein AidB-like acyl-CoA dehydrogenase
LDFALPASVEAFRGRLRAWLAENLTPEVRAAGRTRGGPDPAAFELLRAWDSTMADAGWGAISWPEEYGGRGAAVLEELVLTEETVRAGAPTPINAIGLNNIAPAIMAYGTGEQKRTFLPRMLRADDIWCQGMSEPDAGSDLASLRTLAVLEGDTFVVNGQKTWTSLAQYADCCALFARTNLDVPKHQGISCLLVDMGTPGIEVRPLVTITGEAEFNEIFFEDVRVPAAALLGPLDGGWGVATSTLTHERAGAARLYALTRARLDELVDDLRAADGGEALGDAVVLARLGEIEARLAYLRILCLRAISLTRCGRDPSGQASVAKIVWAELEQDLAVLGCDLIGPTGADGRWATAVVSSRGLTIAGGTTQVNKNITAQRVLGLPRG